MMKYLNKIPLNQWISHISLWLGLMLMALSLELVALYYQYQLDEWPCVLCIHFRLLVALMGLLALLGLLFKANYSARIIITLALLIVFIVMAERAYQLLGVERGFIVSECELSLGLPEWFAIDHWLPSIFAAKTTCGYTPILIYGITMAEALIFFSSTMILFSILMLRAAITPHNSRSSSISS